MMIGAIVALALLTSSGPAPQTQPPGLAPWPPDRFVFDMPGYETWTSWVSATQSQRTVHVQTVLSDLGFFRGAIDGSPSRSLDAAVVTFHKATDRPRAVSWTVFDERSAQRWHADVPTHGREPDRVEVDLDRQVLYLFREGELAAVLPISSGNGKPYVHPYGYRVRAARTPEGDFTFYRRIDGLRRAPLGTLYRPWYFSGGFAVHGSPSVPPWPASHGCVRVTNWDADFLAEALELGMPVHVWSAESRPPEPLTVGEDISSVFD